MNCAVLSRNNNMVFVGAGPCACPDSCSWQNNRISLQAKPQFDIFPRMKEEEENTKVVCTNRKAHYLYEVLESLEAGLVLVGTEVKSLRSGKANLKDSFAIFKNGELFVLNMHVSPYEQGNRYNLNPTRPRKLLLHKKEMRKLFGKVAERGLTLIPLKLYFKGKVAKIELALAKGKKVYDRKRDIKERDMQREMQRAFREKNR